MGAPSNRRRRRARPGEKSHGQGTPVLVGQTSPPRSLIFPGAKGCHTTGGVVTTTVTHSAIRAVSSALLGRQGQRERLE